MKSLSLEERLIRFLEREEEDERKSSRDLRALAIEERVLEGECIRDAILREQQGDRFTFSLEENLSKFRNGDPLTVGDGLDFQEACPLVYGDYDSIERKLILRRDPFQRGATPRLVPGVSYCIDRRHLGIRGRLRDVVRAAFEDELLASVLMGEHKPERDEERLLRAQEALSKRGLNETQFLAGTNAIASDSLSLIQGPPGTGKTRLLAEIMRVLCASGCKIALSAFTHRAVDNALMALARIAPEIPLVKLGRPGPGTQALTRAGIRFEDPRRGRMPQEGAVVAGTCFALAKLPARERFHFTVFDEAGQLPIPHALAGMLLARRWIFFGDHRQLPPVITAEHVDREVQQSIFERLHGFYGGDMLDETYRMNDALCAVVSDLFYGGGLKSAPSSAARRLSFTAGGKLDAVLDPEHSVVFARVDHLQPGQRSTEEARLVADLVADLIEHHGLEPESLGVIAPFRAQVRLLRASCQRRGVRDLDKITIDTVERIQGQEREVIILSLAVGDPDTLNARAAFFFSKNRLNVALSRARSKAILVASSAAFRALPQDPDSLRAVAVFRRLATELHQVDLSSLYCSSSDSKPAKERKSKADRSQGKVASKKQEAESQAKQEGTQEMGEAAM